jgi:hypothetical protein
MTRTLAHETLPTEEASGPGSERAFGVVFAAVFAVVGLLPLLGGHAPRWWSLLVAAALLGVALLAPRALAPCNRIWFRFGMLLHHVMTPLVLLVLFVLSIVPIALLLRICRKDLLRLRPDPDADSYWIAREPPGPPPESLGRQF